MGLVDALQTPPQARQCKFTLWLDSLSLEDRQAVEDAMSNRLWSIEKLLDALKSEGAPVNYGMLRKHRAKVCPICYDSKR